MSIDFGPERWEETKDNYRKWWAGELERPLLHFVMPGGNPDRPEPALPSKSFTVFYDLSVSADEIVDRWDYDLCCQRFLGDSFPAVFPNFGPGVGAEFLGCGLEIDEPGETVWFHPKEDASLDEMRIAYTEDSLWFKRIADIKAAAGRRWQGEVQIGMTDLGGAVDILSSFRPSEKLLLDLYDSPERVKELTWQIHDAWLRYYEQFDRLLKPTNPGYSCWATIFSCEPHYMLQCDFAYMIGPDMFEEFVLPELAAVCKKLPNCMYHLDGPGQIPHLDSLLSIPELKGIQWVPGAGNPDCAHWPEVYGKIRKAGKLIQAFGGPEVLDALNEQLGTLKGVQLWGWGGAENEAATVECIKKYSGKTGGR